MLYLQPRKPEMVILSCVMNQGHGLAGLPFLRVGFALDRCAMQVRLTEGQVPMHWTVDSWYGKNIPI